MDHTAIFGITLLLIIVIVAMWAAWKGTAAYSSITTVKSFFNNTQRYIVGRPLLSLNNIQVSFIARCERQSSNNEEDVQKTIQTVLINPLEDTILTHESTVFELPADVSAMQMRRQGYEQPVTLENLAVAYFKQLAPLLSELHLTLTKITLQSDNSQVEYARHKITNYMVK